MEHAPHNAMTDAAEIERFRDRASDLMGALLDELARSPGVARTFPEVEAALGWPRRRIASVLGGVSHMRHTEFGGHRPYRFLDGRGITIGRQLIGPYITSLEMAGCSITLLKLDEELTRLWDAPVDTPALRWGV